MASIFKRKSKSKKPFGVSYKDPVSLKWKKCYFKNLNQAKLFESKHETIEICLKSNDPSWKTLYYEIDKVVTIRDIFDAYIQNELQNKSSHLTIKNIKRSCKVLMVS